VGVALSDTEPESDTVPDGLGVIDADAPGDNGGVGVFESDELRVGDDDDVGEPVPVRDPVAVPDDVGVEESVIVVEPVPESEPVFDGLAPEVRDAVGVRDSDRERLDVELGVKVAVPVSEFVGVLVGVPLPVTLAVRLDVSEMLGVTLALAPRVTEGVAE